MLFCLMLQWDAVEMMETKYDYCNECMFACNDSGNSGSNADE